MSRKNTYQSLQNLSEQVQSRALDLRFDRQAILTTEILSTGIIINLVLVLIIINAALTA